MQDNGEWTQSEEVQAVVRAIRFLRQKARIVPVDPDSVVFRHPAGGVPAAVNFMVSAKEFGGMWQQLQKPQILQGVREQLAFQFTELRNVGFPIDLKGWEPEVCQRLLDGYPVPAAARAASA